MARFGPLEETLVGIVHPLNDLLHRLRTELLPLGIVSAQPGDVTLQTGFADVSTEPAVVPSLQRNAMVVDHSRHVDLRMQVAVAPVGIQTVLIRTSDFQHSV